RTRQHNSPHPRPPGRSRSGRIRPRRQPESTGGQHHGRDPIAHRVGGKATANGAGAGADNGGGVSPLAAKAATTTIPIVFVGGDLDPVNPRRDMIWVAAAGPTMNIALAILAALAFHLIDYLPGTAAPWVAENLKNALIINVVLAVFNLFPLPPLDGGRIAVGVLPDAVASPLARLEPYGMLILIGLLFILP